MRRERRALGQPAGERERVVRVQRAEPDAGAPRSRPRREAAADVAPCRQDQPRQLGQRVEHGVEQGRRRRVHVVRVLDQEHGRRRERRGEEAHDRLVQPLRAERVPELRDLVRLRHREPERDREQRQPGREARRALFDRGLEACQHRVGRVVPARADHVPQQLAPRRVGVGAAVRLARGQVHGAADGVLLDRLQQARLPDAGLADQLGEAARAAAGGGERLAQLGQLRVAADERVGGVRRARGARAGDRRADRPGLHRPRLALELERRQPGEREARGRAVEHGRRRVDRAGRRGGHQPGREVDRVADPRVRPAVRGTDVARERPPAMHADLRRQRPRAVGDRAERPQHPLLVVADRARRAGAEHQLAPVDVDVGAQQRDLVRVGRLLHVRDELVHGRRRGRRAGARDRGVGAAEAHEGDRDDPVLGRLPAGEHVAAHGDREAEREPRGVDLGHGRLRARVLAAGRRAQQPPRPGRRAERALRQRRGDVAADHDVTRARDALHPQRAGHRGAGEHGLPVRAAGQEEQHVSGFDPDRHAQRHADAGRGDRAGGPQRAAHPYCGAAGALAVPVALEEHEQRVAAELQQPAAVAVGDLEQRGERRADRVADPLGALGPHPRKPLRQLREAAHVGEHERPRQRPDRRPGIARELADHDPRKVRRQRVRVRVGRRRGARRSHPRSLRPAAPARHYPDGATSPVS